MPLIQLVEVLIVVGVGIWLVNRFVPMQATIKSILNPVVVIAAVLGILNVSGLFHSFSSIRIGSRSLAQTKAVKKTECTNQHPYNETQAGIRLRELL